MFFPKPYLSTFPRLDAPQVQAIHVIDEMFSVENGMLTPTFKIKRNAVKDAYQAELDALYTRLPDEA